ncbi:MAG TPA: DUF167 domain-containing protein [bacterium]|nr:DUF167 domain-containing protein [bacterium]HPN29334.1 DUF167 domain-containing protein [bacterium]
MKPHKIFPENKSNQTTVKIKVQANANKNLIIGFIDSEILKIKIKSPAVDNKANKELIDFLAEKTGLKKNSVEIMSGAANPIKIVKITGISKNDFYSIVQKSADLKK